MRYFSILFLISFIVIFSGYTYGQSLDQFCPGLPEEDQGFGISSFIPATGEFRTLIILCKFSDDNFDLAPFTDLWPHTLNSMPSWGPGLVSKNVASTYSNPSLSGYFKTMSNGSFDLVGDVYFYQPQHIQSHYYESNGQHIGYLVEEILTAINDSVDFADYDNNNDGNVDLIQICFRFAETHLLDSAKNNYGRYGGIAGLTGFQETFGSGTTLVMDGKTISAAQLGSGTFCKGICDPNFGLMAHEIGHYLFGAIHYAGVGFHGLMDGQGTGIMSSYERIKLGWLEAIPISSDTVNLEITDVLTTNKVYKVSNGSTYFLIDNHQRQNYYESTWPQYNGGPLVSPGTGILITHCSSSSLDVESASGKWKWEKSGGLYVFPFKELNTNRIYGEDKLNLREKNTTAGPKKNHPDFLGSSTDFFNMGYNQVFSPWSNPSTYPDNSNIAVELTENSNGIIKVNIYTSNAQNASISKPQNFKVAVVSNHPYLTWEANLEPNLSGYNVYKKIKLESGATSTFTEFTTNTSLTDNFTTTSPRIAHDSIQYWIKAIKVGGSSIETAHSGIYNGISFYQWKINNHDGVGVTNFSLANYPNPFNPVTRIEYHVPQDGFVTIRIYNALGKEVATLLNERKSAGIHFLDFDGSQLASGIYISTLSTEGMILSNKMMLLK